ncbi:glyoxalase [Pseudoclavibacter endophyticus]|uniref:VOC family protein n=1 Tax=Pseudoclavibacter endophyticus TaxID=1778590 RepID=A0A6H9WJ86_9MICO|nr:VOC family protein [Pseudoclavibacter endophyticus]KAB1648876.1 VOC family protein [Pseudoclavibacter endophyticus]GGA67598.1 glyoxalase [Pseudoclavibacter endophyticus]
MNDHSPLRGLCTISLWADDVAAAATWYTEFLGVEPYFVRPEPPLPAAYVEFRIGDSADELGIISSDYRPGPAPRAPGGVVAYWHVDDVAATLDDAIARGATPHQPLTPREAGFVTASFVDPFGNVVGIMHNPHYREQLAR